MKNTIASAALIVAPLVSACGASGVDVGGPNAIIDTLLTIGLPAEPHPLDAADREGAERRVSSSPSRFREEYLAALPEA